jgi:hypothetical protein
MIVIFFFTFIISVSGDHCEYLPRAPEDLATSLCGDCIKRRLFAFCSLLQLSSLISSTSDSFHSLLPCHKSIYRCKEEHSCLKSSGLLPGVLFS